ncbi:MAG: RimK family alpha-L-glutamate ligase [Candidatus Odinarchaeota archaeon]
MKKKIVFSARQDHEIITKLIKKLKEIKNIKLILHDPTKEFYCLSEMPQEILETDLLIVKVRNECSIDLLHYAKIYDIPTLHSIDTVLLCMNKIALDYAIRKIFNTHKKDLEKFLLPNSWNQSLSDLEKFKKWASKKLPIVIKSHYQHDKYNRFNFLVQKIEDIDKFCERYKEFLSYDVYIQEFIECDGIERKIYVIGDKVFGIERENPIYIYLRDKPENIDVSLIEREEFEVTEDIKRLSKILSEELNLKIFGFDLVKPIDLNKYYFIDLNDFPSFKGIPNADLELKKIIENFIENL